jgi:hypothetical protein
MTRSLLFGVVMIGLVTAAAPAAADGPRVALTRMPDDDTGLGPEIKAALDDSELEVVSAKKVDRAIDQLGLDARLATDRDLNQLASELEVDAIVKAAFEHRAHRVRFRIFAQGKQGKPFTIAVRGKPDSKQFHTLVRDTLVAKLTAALPAAEPDDTKPDEPAASEAKPARTHAAVKHKAAARDAADEPEAAATTETTEAATTEVHAVALPPSLDDTGRHANTDAVRVDVGTSFTARTLQFRTKALPTPPMPYKNAPVPGGRVAGELYPFAFTDPHGWLAGLGVAGDFDQVAALTLRASAEPMVGLQATERHYSVGVRYRIAFGDSPTSPTVTLGAGYGARTFTVRRGALMSPGSLDLPDVNYKLFDPGVAARVPLGPWLALTAEARVLLVHDAGAVERPDAYGTTKITAGSASAGFELLLGARFAVRVVGEATQLSLKFAGNGALSNSRDGNPATIDVRGATDRYLGGSATVAVLY